MIFTWLVSPQFSTSFCILSYKLVKKGKEISDYIQIMCQIKYSVKNQNVAFSRAAAFRPPAAPPDAFSTFSPCRSSRSRKTVGWRNGLQWVDGGGTRGSGLLDLLSLDESEPTGSLLKDFVLIWILEEVRV